MMMKWDKCHCTLLTHRLAFCSVSSARLYPSHLHKRVRVSINRIAAAIRAFRPTYHAQNTDPRQKDESGQNLSSFDVEVLSIFSIGLLQLLLLDLGLFTPELHLLCKQLFVESNIVCRCMTDVHKERGTCKTVCINLRINTFHVCWIFGRHVLSIWKRDAVYFSMCTLQV